MNSIENNNPPGFFARLKQHHLYRVAVGYGAAIAVLIQVVARAFPYFGWAAAVPAVIIILIAGFPAALVLAWLLVKPTDPAAQTTWQRRHWVLGAIVTPLVIAAVVVSGIFAFRFSELHAARVAAEQAIAQAETKPAAPVFNPPADSIVVLPFANLSGDPNQAYFSNGITEELTGALGQNTGLTVIAWETASRYANSQKTPAEIGKALNVAHILAGSIEHEGTEVRVSAELVSTVTGQQLWAEHYDDSFKNIFTVQDQITAAIADALKVKFAALQTAPTLNPQAHELYLKGMRALDLVTAADAQVAQNYFQKALKLDPNYANAWSGLSATWLQLTIISSLPPLNKALPKIRAAAHKALELDPHNVHALLELGNADILERHRAQAKAEYQQALALDPNNANAHVLYGFALPLKQALVQTQEGALLDPDSVLAQSILAGIYQDLDEWPRMAAAAQAIIPLSPHNIQPAFLLAFAYTKMQRGEDAVKAFDLVHSATAVDQQLVDAGRLSYQALLQPSLRPKALMMLGELRSVQPGLRVQRFLLQLYLALSEKETALQILTGICTGASVGCGDLAINPEYAPLHGDTRFEKLSRQYAARRLSAAPASASSD